MNSSNDTKRTSTELVRLYSGQNATSLKKQLPDSYQIADPSSYDPEQIDLCIIDSGSWKASHDELLSIRKSQQPVDVPIMMMGKSNTLGRLSRDILEEVDQLLYPPISTDMLLARLQKMRKSRQKSVQLAEKNKKLLQQERTLHNQAERTLEKFKDMVYKAPSAICMLEGPNHQYTYVNKNYRRLFRKEEFKGRTVEEVFPEIVEQGFTDLLDQVYKSGECFRTGERSIKVWNTIKEEWYELEMDFIYKPLADNEGNTYGIFVEVVNVTDEVRYRTELEEKLDEKKMLLAEIHHRVKNNLAVITSLLELQKDQSANEEVQKELTVTYSRIQSIALVHEQLYMEAEADAYINLKSYLPNLIDTLQQINTSPGQDITCRVIADEAHLPLDQAVPTVLMINELLTNAFKHAFGEVQQGNIQISAKSKNNQLQLQIADDGQGLPEDFSLESESMGMQIVSTLLTQLNAEMTCDSTSGQGAVFEIQMPLEDEGLEI